MLTGMLAVRNLVLGQRNDLWSVNTDHDYHEEIRGEAEVGLQEVEEVLQAALTRVFLKLDRMALGLSLGMAAGAILFMATLALLLKGGEVVGPHLYLLSQFFIGYRVTFVGSLIGFAYAFVYGFVGGYSVARMYNRLVDRREVGRRGGG